MKDKEKAMDRRRFLKSSAAGVSGVGLFTEWKDWSLDRDDAREQESSGIKEKVDVLITGGTVLTMNDEGDVIEDGGVAISDGRIVDIGESSKLKNSYTAEKKIDASRKVVMPGLVDTYGHAGHGLIGGFYHPKHGWPAGELYWHRTTDEWWYAEAQLAATERLRFGVTTGASIIGSTPARADSPVFGIRNAEAYAKVGMRAVLGVGPPDVFVPHISDWSGSYLVNGEWVKKEFTYEDAVRNSLEVIDRWHLGANERIRIALAPAYVFGRHTGNGRYGHDYANEDIPVVMEKAREMRALATERKVQIHTHIFSGSIEFAVERFGREFVKEIMGPDLVIAHANGLTPMEIEVVAETRSNVATAPSTAENVRYGVAPIIELLDAGVNVAISTDGSAPRFSFDLFKEIYRTMFHQWMRFKTLSVLPAGKALRMVTIDAAKVLGVDREVGSLEAGKKADVILVDLNSPHLTPETFIPQQIAFYANGNDVDTVLVDGKVLMEGRQIKSVDVSEVMELARTEANKVFDRVDLDNLKPGDHEFWHGSKYSD
jgi:cytosine/adenosine deaminase-related metal-dependent hydrolase